MNETVKELITADIFDTLAKISALTGHQNEAIAERQAVRGNIPKDRLLKIDDDGDTPIDEGALQKSHYTANYSIWCFASSTDRPDETAPDLDAVLTRIVADVRKALSADWSRGGWAYNTRFGADAAIPAEQGRAGYQGRVLPLMVDYRVQRLAGGQEDPYSL